jgi:hypothetical protein
MLQGNKLITPNFRGMFEWCNEKTNNNHKKNREYRVVEGVISPFDLQKQMFITNVIKIQPITQYRKNLVQIWL